MLLGANSNSLTVGSHVTHNTFVQILWKLGLFGCLIIMFWFIYVHDIAKRLIGFSQKSFRDTIVIFIAFFLPLMALDKFFFDEFYWFYIIYLLCRIEPRAFIDGGSLNEKNISCGCDLFR